MCAAAEEEALLVPPLRHTKLVHAPNKREKSSDIESRPGKSPHASTKVRSGEFQFLLHRATVNPQKDCDIVSRKIVDPSMQKDGAPLLGHFIGCRQDPGQFVACCHRSFGTWRLISNRIEDDLLDRHEAGERSPPVSAEIERHTPQIGARITHQADARFACEFCRGVLQHFQRGLPRSKVSFEAGCKLLVNRNQYTLKDTRLRHLGAFRDWFASREIRSGVTVWFLVHLAPNLWTSQPESPPYRPADALLVHVIVTTVDRDAGRCSEIAEQV